MPACPDTRLRCRQRLTAAADFEAAYSQGRSYKGRLMVLWLRRGEGAALRLGVVASRKIGGAVQRNRAKRRLRAAYRLNRHRFTGSVDAILIARRDILTAPWTEVAAELLRLARKAGMGT